jgi:hypothetical protein
MAKKAKAKAPAKGGTTTRGKKLRASEALDDAAQAQAAAGSANAGSGFKPISKKALEELVVTANRCLERNSVAAGEMGKAIKEAVDKQGLEAIAFRMVLRLARKGDRDPIKLRSILDNFDYYRDVLRLDDLAAPNIPGIVDEPKTKRSRRAKDETASEQPAMQASEGEPAQTDLEDAIAGADPNVGEMSLDPETESSAAVH